MARFAEAKFTIRAVNKTQKAFDQIGRGVDNMDRRFKKLGGGLSRLGRLFAVAFVGRQIINKITKFEKLEASLRTVTGSAEKAAVAFRFIQDFAATTPFQLEEVTDAFIKLKALGLIPSEEALTSYGNTATAMGKSLNQMIEAVADAATGEFERLKEFGIKARTQGDQVTFTFQGISTTVGKNAQEIEGYLRSIGDVQFAGAMKEQAGTLNVALSNMGDAFSKLVKAIGDAGLTYILMKIANAIRWLAEKITAAIPLFKLGFKAFIGEVMKFGNLFIAVFKGVGQAFRAFGETISARFEALGKDLAAFIEIRSVVYRLKIPGQHWKPVCSMRWEAPLIRRLPKPGSLMPPSMRRSAMPPRKSWRHATLKINHWQACLGKPLRRKKPLKPSKV